MIKNPKQKSTLGTETQKVFEPFTLVSLTVCFWFWSRMMTPLFPKTSSSLSLFTLMELNAVGVGTHHCIDYIDGCPLNMVHG